MESSIIPPNLTNTDRDRPESVFNQLTFAGTCAAPVYKVGKLPLFFVVVVIFEFFT